jgi:3-methyladenine DNA glycosylase AlkC
MAEELRNIYNIDFVNHLIQSIETVYKPFNADRFRELVFQQDWHNLALKERMRRLTFSLHESLPINYREALEILYQVAPQFTGLGGIIFPDYVDQYGLDDWEESMKALSFFTPFSTSEFAVRPFLIKDQERMLQQMQIWSIHPNEHIRRLASEGCRPRLPWGMSVPSLKRTPEVTLPILFNLKEDESLYVRKSVANHLNDISYTHSDLVIKLAKEWYGNNPYTDWIIKHACRSLLKKGHPEALTLFGFGDDKSIEFMEFTIDSHPIQMGESIDFSFTLHATKSLPVRVEYAIDFVKSKGQRSRKVFMISSTQMKKNDIRRFTKQHSFKELTTRKHYKGTHTLSIIINGATKATLDFELI